MFFRNSSFREAFPTDEVDPFLVAFDLSSTPDFSTALNLASELESPITPSLIISQFINTGINLSIVAEQHGLGVDRRQRQLMALAKIAESAAPALGLLQGEVDFDAPIEALGGLANAEHQWPCIGQRRGNQMARWQTLGFQRL